MSEQIDWSKAPEGSMVLLKHVRDNRYAWAVSHSEDARAWHKRNIRCSFHLMASMWRVVAERPATPSWSGEGLPPVGVICEAAIPHTSGPDNERSFIWIEGSVIAYCEIKGKTYAWFAEDNGFYPPAVLEFRPIRTPEQIAADEREAAVNGMLCYDALGGSRRGLAEALYDAGYRKQSTCDPTGYDD